MTEAPKQPRNAEVVSKDGQFNQAHARWWDSIASRAYSAIRGFNSLVTGSAFDFSADQIIVYDASEVVVKKATVSSLIASTAQAEAGTKDNLIITLP